jgi:hypothetical protein
MEATHFLMKRLPKVATEMALHVLAYNLTRDEYYGHSTADGRDPSIVKVEKWLVYRLPQFKPLLAKRFETTKTHRWGNRPTSLWIAEEKGCCASG